VVEIRALRGITESVTFGLPPEVRGGERPAQSA
jgi:hypothetical protein